MRSLSYLSWNAQHRKTLIVLLVAACIYLSIRLYLNPVYVSDPQPSEPSRAAEVEDRINPNTADVNTLAALPTIGIKRAEDIVAYREKFVIDHPGRLAFESARDLMNITGIGTATAAQLDPFLIYSPRPRPATMP